MTDIQFDPPPDVSRDWTAAERLNVIRWHLSAFLTVLDSADPDMPVIMRDPTQAECLWCIAVATWPREDLERYRRHLLQRIKPPPEMPTAKAARVLRDALDAISDAH